MSKGNMPRLYADNLRETAFLTVAGILAAGIVVVVVNCAYMKPFVERRKACKSISGEIGQELARLPPLPEGGLEHWLAQRKVALEAVNVPKLLPIASNELETVKRSAAKRGREVKADVKKLIEQCNVASKSASEAIETVRKAENAKRSMLDLLRGVEADRQIANSMSVVDRLRELREGAVLLGQMKRPPLKDFEILQTSVQGAFSQVIAAQEAANRLVVVGGKVSENEIHEHVTNPIELARKRHAQARRDFDAAVEAIGALPMDSSGLMKRADEIDAEVAKARKEINGAWILAQNASRQAKEVLRKANATVEKAGTDAKALIQLHGAYVATAELEAAQDGFSKSVDNLRRLLADWREDGLAAIEKRKLEESANKAAVDAAELRKADTASDFAKQDHPDPASTSEFVRQAAAFKVKIEDELRAAQHFADSAEKAVASARRKLPDWGAKMAALNKERRQKYDACNQMLKEAGDLLDKCDDFKSDENVKANIRTALENGRSALLKLSSKIKDDIPAATAGLAFDTREKEWKALLGTIQEAVGQHEKAKKLFDDAVANGTLYKVDYRPGAEIWCSTPYSPDFKKRAVVPKTDKDGYVNLGAAVTAAGLAGNRPLPRLELKFAVIIPVAGRHKVMIQIMTAENAFINSAAKNKGISRRNRNGEIILSYTFDGANGKMKDQNEVSFGNGRTLKWKDFLMPIEADVPEGFVDCHFTIESLRLDAVEVDSSTISSSWNYNPISFRVLLDGDEVPIFHAEAVPPPR